VSGIEKMGLVVGAGVGLFWLIFGAGGEVLAEGPEMFLEISPAGVRTEMVGGERKSFEMTVKNIGTGTAEVRVYAKPYNVNGDDYGIDLETENLHSQIYKWIEFAEAEFRLGVGEEKRVEYTITVPENVVMGGQYAAIFAETTGERLGEGDSGVWTTIRTTSLLYARVTNDEVRDVRVQFEVPMLNVGTKILGVGTVYNDGNVDADVEYRFEVWPLFGGGALYTVGERRVVLPDPDEVGQAEKFEWGETPFFGVFRVKYVVGLPWEEKVVERVVMVMPWPFMVMFWVIVVLAGVWVVLVVRGRRRRFVRRGEWRR
jgi:hypothetical protein